MEAGHTAPFLLGPSLHSKPQPPASTPHAAHTALAVRCCECGPGHRDHHQRPEQALQGEVPTSCSHLTPANCSSDVGNALLTHHCGCNACFTRHCTSKLHWQHASCSLPSAPEPPSPGPPHPSPFPAQLIEKTLSPTQPPLPTPL